MHDQNISLMAIQETGKWEPTDGFFVSHKIIQNKFLNDQLGVAIIADKSLYPEHLDLIEDDSVDAVWCQVKLKNKRVIIGSVYTKPTNGTEGINNLISHIKKVHEYGLAHNFNSIIIYGDFNARNTEWGDHSSNKRGQVLNQFIDNGNFTLCSPFDYTFSCSTGGSVIDLVLATGPIINQFGLQWIEKEAELFTGAPARGHFPVLQQVLEPSTNSNVKTKCSDWKNGDWKSWQDEVELKTRPIGSIQSESLDGLSLWDKVLAIIQEATRKYIPEKTISVHSKPFWTSELTSQLNIFLAARKKYKRRSTPCNKTYLDDQKEKFKSELTKAKNQWIRNRSASLNVKDSTLFWKKYKKVFGLKQDNYIGNLVERNKLVTADSEKEKLMFETFFTGRHLKSQEVDKEHNRDMLSEYSSIMEEKDKMANEREAISSTDLDCEITEQEIRDCINRQQVEDKSTDFNNIHPLVLKNLGPAAISSLHLLFNWALDNEKWIWDLSYVTFIRKQYKSTYCKPGSYRPLSISSYMGKLLERILDTRLRNYFQSKGEIDDDQEGFRQGRSTVRYLFRMLGSLTEIKRQKLACIILFIDFEKAYDSVHLPTLIVKLKKYGITGKILGIIHSFLFQRKIQLKINGYLGIVRDCDMFGLPQGSVIAPFLFIIYIADMVNNIPPRLRKWLTCFKFADDGTFFIAHPIIYECYRLMQWLCDQIANWCQRNWLVINCDQDKTEAIILKTGNKTSNQMPPELQIGSKKVKYVKSTKVLGLIVDEELNFHRHADQKLKDCRKKWGLLTKSTYRNYGLNVCSLTLLLKTTVLTKLFYGAPVWINKQIGLFREFWNKIIMKLTGATLNPHRILSEIVLHLPPLEVQAEIITTKFLCKTLTSDDNITATLLQIDGSLSKEFHDQLAALKRFFLRMDETHQFRRIRDIELCNIKNKKVLHYSKNVILQYQQEIWLDNAKKQCNYKESKTSDRTINVIEYIQSEGFLLNHRNSLFNHDTTKKEDSFVLDFIHGNSLIFGKSRKAVLNQVNSNCYFCNTEGDSAEHQLFFCDSLKDKTHDDFLQIIESPTLYLNQVIAPNIKEWLNQSNFIKRVKYLMTQHEQYIAAKQNQ